jgi:hypothetical protein
LRRISVRGSRLDQFFGAGARFSGAYPESLEITWHAGCESRPGPLRGRAPPPDLLGLAARSTRIDDDRLPPSRALITRTVLFNQFLNAAESRDRAGVAHIAGRLLDSLREFARLAGELHEVSGCSATKRRHAQNCPALNQGAAAAVATSAKGEGSEIESSGSDNVEAARRDLAEAERLAAAGRAALPALRSDHDAAIAAL